LRSMPIMMRSLAFSKSLASASSLFTQTIHWLVPNRREDMVYLLVLVDCLSDGSVDEVLDLCPREARTHLGKHLGNHVCAVCDLVQVEVENVDSSIDVGVGNVDFFVEPSRSDRSWV